MMISPNRSHCEKIKVGDIRFLDPLGILSYVLFTFHLLVLEVLVYISGVGSSGISGSSMSSAVYISNVIIVSINHKNKKNINLKMETQNIQQFTFVIHSTCIF